MTRPTSCPACTQPMWIVQKGRLEVDFCPACQGVWLDSGELERLLGEGGLPPEKIVALLEEGRKRGTKKGRRRCPRCPRRMLQFEVPAATPITLDSCRAGHGLWFDRGELERLIAAVSSSAQELHQAAALIASGLAFLHGGQASPKDAERG